MKSFVQYVVLGTLFLLAAVAARADDTPGLHIIIDNAHAAAPMTLVPGFYVNAGQGAMTGGQEPRAAVVRITEATAVGFAGTLEILRLDRTGGLVRMSSKLSGTIGTPGITSTPGKLVINSMPPLSVSVLDEPLHSLIQVINGNLRPDGFRLQWQPLGKEVGYDKLGEGGEFVFTTEDSYQQVVAQYQQMSVYKIRLMEFQAASAHDIEDRLSAYMRDSDRWLHAPVDDSGEQVIAKMLPLYAQAKTLMADQQPDTKEAAHRQAKLLVMQLDVYWSQINYLKQLQEKQQRDRHGAFWSLDYAVESSPCMEVTSPRLDYGVSPACDSLSDSYKAAQLRDKEVNRARGDANRDQAKNEQELECIWSEAHHLIEPNRAVFPICDKPEYALQ
jgi:hypothetical protein